VRVHGSYSIAAGLTQSASGAVTGWGLGDTLEGFDLQGHSTGFSAVPVGTGLSVAEDCLGHVFIAGLTIPGSRDGTAASLTRMTADGAPDAAFGAAGTVSYYNPGQMDRFWSVVALPGGTVLAGGGDQTVFVVLRALP